VRVDSSTSSVNGTEVYRVLWIGRVPGTRVLDERIHPDTGAHLTYIACDMLAGTARVAAVSELDAVEWVQVGELGEYVPGGLYSAVRAYLARLAGEPPG
jgi:8-oxo-dGTP diphosphatase